MELIQRLAELNAGRGVFLRLIHRALADAQRLRGDADTAAIERLHGNLEALSFLAEQILLGDDAVLEHDLRGGRTM